MPVWRRKRGSGMSDIELTEAEKDLHAYVDGALDESGMARVEAYLLANPQAAAKLRAWSRQNNALNRAAQSVSPAEPAPEIKRLTVRLYERLNRQRRSVWPGVAVFAVAFLTGWFGHTIVLPMLTGPAYADEIAQAHLMTTAAPDELLPLSTDRINRLFARIGETPRLPDLRPLGYEAIGAQLLPSDEGAVLHVSYRNAAGVNISYFLIHTLEEDEVPVHVLHRKGVSMAYWQHDHSRYAIASTLTDDQIARIATAIDAAPKNISPPAE